MSLNIIEKTTFQVPQLVLPFFLEHKHHSWKLIASLANNTINIKTYQYSYYSINHVSPSSKIYRSIKHI